MVFVYTLVQRKYFLVMTPDVLFFFIVACFEKVNMIYVKFIFIFSNDGKKSSVFFHCFEFLDKTFSIKTNGFSVQICAIIPF